MGGRASNLSGGTGGENSKVKWGVGWAQGMRPSLEDRFCAFPELEHDRDAAYFAVYDGHGGDQAAEYCAEHLHNTLVKSEAYKERKYHDALKQAFLKTDDEFLTLAKEKMQQDGTTAVGVLIKDNTLYVANAGDSRCIMSQNRVAVPMSCDHKPKDDAEFSRIQKAGGFVCLGRVQGQLAVARAIGDVYYKLNENLKAEEQLVSAEPEIQERTIDDKDDFLLLASDGLYDVMSNDDIVEYVHKGLAEGKGLQQIGEEIVHHSIHDLGTMDNVTAVIVQFKH